MKAIIDGLEVEGSPSEIAELYRALRGQNAQPVAPRDQPKQLSGDNSVTEAFATRAIQRKPLSDAQRQILTTLASKHPAWTSFEELQQATGYSKAQLSGALGAFHRRIAATPGYVDGTVFLSWDWDEAAGSYNYFLSPAAFSAVKRAKL